MKGLILAAGRGSRMEALTRDRPKCMVELGGRSLIAWQIAALSPSGVDELAVVRGYLGDRIAAPGAVFIDNPRWRTTNMVESLMCARDWIGGDTVLVSYSDIVYGAGTVAELKATDGDIGIVYDPNWLALWSRRFANPLDDAETFRASPSGDLLEIGQRTESLDRIAGQFMGLLKFRAEGMRQVVSLVESLPAEARDRLDMTGLLSLLLGRGVRIAARPIAGDWGEVDSTEDLHLYERMLADGALDLSR